MVTYMSYSQVLHISGISSDINWLKIDGKRLEPEGSICKWLFQLDDSTSLDSRWLFNHFHPSEKLIL